MTAAELQTFDLIAIGSGPAGEQAATQAAALGRRAAVVEREQALGGGSATTGTVPSKTLRAAIVELTGGVGGVYSGSFATRHEVTIDDLLWRTRDVIEHEQEAVGRRLRRSGISVIGGTASFVDPCTLAVESDGSTRLVRADRIVIAVGTTPARPPEIAFDDRTILDSDGILKLERLPDSLTVIGGGAIGLEYASMAAALGIHTTLVERRTRVLDGVDEEIAEAMQYHLRGRGLVLRLGDEAVKVERTPEGAATVLARGERLVAGAVLHAGGRCGATAALNLAAAGLEADRDGRLAVGPDLRTEQPHIFAAGDVVGSRNLAATAVEHGRLAALAALDAPAPLHTAGRLPYGIHTIPEISFIGPSEQELATAGVDYVAGRASYRDLARGEIAGDRSGLLKLLVDTATRRVLGVHIFGTSATELVHLGQILMAGDLPVDYVVDAVFNVPTFSHAYKVAALDAVSRLDDRGSSCAA